MLVCSIAAEFVEHVMYVVTGETDVQRIQSDGYYGSVEPSPNVSSCEVERELLLVARKTIVSTQGHPQVQLTPLRARDNADRPDATEGRVRRAVGTGTPTKSATGLVGVACLGVKELSS